MYHVRHSFLNVIYFHYRHVHQNELDDTSDIGTGSCFVMDERGSRKLLFKKRSTSSTCAVRVSSA
jgi:hypothetical protein